MFCCLLTFCLLDQSRKDNWHKTNNNKPFIYYFFAANNKNNNKKLVFKEKVCSGI